MAGLEVSRICKEAHSQGFQLLDKNGKPYEYSTWDLYRNRCYDIFDDAQTFQRFTLGEHRSRMLGASHIRRVADFAKKHNLKVNICGYGSAFPSTFSAQAGAINISPRAPYYHREWLSWSLDHEYGHMRDNRLIAAYAPDLKRALMQGRGNGWEARRYVSTVLKLMRDRLSKPDQVEFDRLRNEVLGKLDHYNKRQELLVLMKAFGEVFRYGEHILEPRFETYVMSDAFRHLKNRKNRMKYYSRISIANHKGERLDLARLLFVAAFKESNMWDRFIRHPEYEPSSLRYIRPNHLKFFRLCIRGASRYFINTAAR